MPLSNGAGKRLDLVADIDRGIYIGGVLTTGAPGAPGFVRVRADDTLDPELSADGVAKIPIEPDRGTTPILRVLLAAAPGLAPCTGRLFAFVNYGTDEETRYPSADGYAFVP